MTVANTNLIAAIHADSLHVDSSWKESLLPWRSPNGTIGFVSIITRMPL